MPQSTMANPQDAQPTPQGPSAGATGSALCACEQGRVLHEVYGDDLGLGAYLWIDSETGERTEEIGPRHTVKLRCLGCGQLSLDTMTFPGRE